MAAFRSERPDLVITDIIMLEQEGIQTITDISSVEPDAKIIVISGGGRIGNADFPKIARYLGAADTIAKPFDPDELLSRVKACLARTSYGATPLRDMPSSDDRPTSTVSARLVLWILPLESKLTHRWLYRLGAGD